MYRKPVFKPTYPYWDSVSLPNIAVKYYSLKWVKNIGLDELNRPCFKYRPLAACVQVGNLMRGMWSGCRRTMPIWDASCAPPRPTARWTRPLRCCNWPSTGELNGRWTVTHGHLHHRIVFVCCSRLCYIQCIVDLFRSWTIGCLISFLPPVCNTDCSEADIHPELKSKNTMYYKGVDKEGHKIRKY